MPGNTSYRERLDTIAAVLWIAQDNRCFYCEVPFTGPKFDKFLRHDQWTRDHFFPRCLGNSRERNTVLSCVRCNAEKGARIPNDRERKLAYELWMTCDRIGALMFGPLWAWGTPPERHRYGYPHPLPPAALLGDLLTNHPLVKAVIHGRPQDADCGCPQ